MPWAPHSLFVEMYLNGVYEGTYQLIEEVKVDNHRVNITELTETQTSGDLTGGYLMEIDGHEDEPYMFTTPQGYPIGLKDPDFSPDPEVPAQTSYISNYVDTAENALFASNFTDPTSGWRAYFDEASSINYYIVNSVMGNAGGFSFFSSAYLYKNVDNPLIYMGPVWDFDISSGNVDVGQLVDPILPWTSVESRWYLRWFTDPGYQADVVTQWNAIKNAGIFSNWLASIGQQAATLEQSQVNNFGRWPMQGIRVWPNAEAAGSYDGELAYLNNWINLRIAYLDSLFNSKTPTTTALGLPTGTLYNGSSVSLAARVKGGTSPSGTVSFLASGVVIGAAPLQANGVATLITSSLPTGTLNFQAVYNGDSVNALSASTSHQASVMPALIGSTTSIASGSLALDTCTAANFSVSVLGSSGAAIPTGSVSLTSNGTAVGSPSPLFNGVAIITASALASGTNSVQAVYSGDSTYLGSASNIISVPVAGTCSTRLPSPTFSLPSGAYSGTQNVSISDGTSGVKIYYTTDGTTPNTTSALYSQPIQLNGNTNVYGAAIILQAIAVKSGSTKSAVAAAVYSIKLAFASMPAAVSATPNPASGLSNTFTLKYSDTYGASYLNSVAVMFSSAVTQSNSCTVFLYTGDRSPLLCRTIPARDLQPSHLDPERCPTASARSREAAAPCRYRATILSLLFLSPPARTFTGKHSVFLFAEDNSSVQYRLGE